MPEAGDISDTEGRNIAVLARQLISFADSFEPKKDRRTSDADLLRFFRIVEVCEALGPESCKKYKIPELEKVATAYANIVRYL